ncbi:MAG: hypothetical protein ABIH52_02810 [Candidatus Aenigmatarchaeota archaeon]|nr:hypothetical protein [Nanoarchaeota archaeon]
MKKQDKKLLVSILGAIGLIVILVGIFTPLDFIYSLLAAIIIWIFTGILEKYWKVKKL